MSSPSIDQQLQKHHWSLTSHPIWLASQIKLKRNLKSHNFPHKLDPKQQLELTKMLHYSFRHCSSLKGGLFCLLKDLSSSQKLYLYEYYLQAHNYHGMHHSEAIFAIPDQKVHLLINGDEHLSLQLISTENQLENAWKNLLNIEHELSNELGFAFDSTLGYLTSDFKQCGTGLEISLFLHLPALIHSEMLLKILNGKLVKINSLSNDPNSFIGHLVIISNQQTIGLSEESIFQNLQAVAIELLAAEKKARQEIEETNALPLKNLANKSFGTLKHALKLDVVEALDALSLVKLGLEMGWLQGVASRKITELMWNIRKGGLYQQSLEGDLTTHRAKLIQKVVNKINS